MEKDSAHLLHEAQLFVIFYMRHNCLFQLFLLRSKVSFYSFLNNNNNDINNIRGLFKTSPQ
jgi:hypothetical protein